MISINFDKPNWFRALWKEYKWIVPLVILTFYGAVLRLYDLGSQSFWMDEATSAIHGLAILKHGIPLLSNGVLSWNFAPVHYLIAAGIFLSGEIHTGARLFGALSGAILVPAIYFLSLQIYRSRVQAIVSSGIIAFLFYEIGWSRQARMYSYLQLFVVVAVGLFYRFLNKRKKVDLLAAALFMILGIFTHPAGYIIPIIFATALIFENTSTKSWYAWLKRHPYFTGSLIFFFLALVLFLSRISNYSGASFVRELLSESHFPSLFGRYFSFIFLQLKFLVFWVIGGMLLSLVLLFKREKKKIMLFIPLVIVIGIYFLIISTKVYSCHLRYILPIFIFFPIFASYLFAWLKRKIGRFRKRAYYPLVNYGLIVLFAGSFLSARLGFRPRSEYFLEVSAPQPDWRRGYEWIIEDAKTRYANIDKLDIASAFPRFNYLYKGRSDVDSYYLPCFWRPSSLGPVKDIAPYTKATTITTIEELNRLQGYIILDRFGLMRQKNPEIRRILQKKEFIHQITSPEGFDLMIWAI